MVLYMKWCFPVTRFGRDLPFWHASRCLQLVPCGEDSRESPPKNGQDICETNFREFLTADVSHRPLSLVSTCQIPRAKFGLSLFAVQLLDEIVYVVNPTILVSHTVLFYPFDSKLEALGGPLNRFSPADHSPASRLPPQCVYCHPPGFLPSPWAPGEPPMERLERSALRRPCPDWRGWSSPVSPWRPVTWSEESWLPPVRSCKWGCQLHIARM